MWQSDWLVYRYFREKPDLDDLNRRLDELRLQKIEANNENINSIFKHDSLRVRAFKKNLKRNARGIILCGESNWVTYAWMSNPNYPGPSHLPGWVTQLGAYWIFGCHTSEAYRGKGYYKLALTLLVSLAFQQTKDPLILIDTEPSNNPSRRAIISAGFLPKGLIAGRYIKIPKIGRYTWGQWDQEYSHPPL